eukprot:3766476-Rhodomonas_salina.1
MDFGPSMQLSEAAHQMLKASEGSERKRLPGSGEMLALCDSTAGNEEEESEKRVGSGVEHRERERVEEGREERRERGEEGDPTFRVEEAFGELTVWAPLRK